MRLDMFGQVSLRKQLTSYLEAPRAMTAFEAKNRLTADKWSNNIRWADFFMFLTRDPNPFLGSYYK